MYRETVNRVEEYCRENGFLKEDLGIVAGLSGGADSVFLLLILKELEQRWRLRIAAVHVNHGIRGEEAARDEEFAGRLAEKLGIVFHRFGGDIPAIAAARRMSEEEAGREFRYECFERVRGELGYDYIAVAHHRQDQAETVLFQMLRGSGVRGMGGMRAVRGKVVRPLLCIDRAEILQGLEEKGVGYCTDSTNGENRYCRNRIRNEIFPLLDQVHQGAAKHLARLGEEMQELTDYLDRQAEMCFQKIVKREDGCLKVDRQLLISEPDVIQREVLLKMMEQVAGHRKDISSVHVAQLKGLFCGETGKSVDLPYGMQGWTEYQYVCLGKNRDSGTKAEEPGDLVFGEELTLVTSEGEKKVLRAEIEPGESFWEINLKKYCTKCFDYDRMDTMPRFRYWETGDFLWLDREGHRKKLSRIFMDEKIPTRRRKRIPVLAVGSHVLWIPELNRQSAYFYVTRQTRKVLCVHMAAPFEDIYEK